ncbi:MAG: hypothetical protein EA350_02175 [Gemmatimonadales bacterium]|nr:MAG: hypothetical protein EA350_02175 [Gemmatimonadales bacterium]
MGQYRIRRVRGLDPALSCSPPGPSMRSPVPVSRLRPGIAALLGILALAGCDGSNLFVDRPITAPPPPAVDARAEVLRYVEEATLLVADDTQLRFRWMSSQPRLILPASLPVREREAFRRAAGMIRAAGGPTFLEVTSGQEAGAVLVEAFSPGAYRALDPTRPWSFSRTFVTATVETGITEVRVAVSLELEGPVLDRAALHALGHAIGLMGHPAFPGATFVMASSPDGSAPPTVFHPWEAAGIRFLYAPAISAGMSRTRIRAAFQGFTL